MPHDTTYSKAMPKVPYGFPSERFIRRSEDWRGIALNTAVSRQFCVTNIGHFPSAKHHWIDREAGSIDNILIYNRSGIGRAFIGTRSWTVPPHHILFIPQGQPHVYHADETTPWSIYWLHFCGESSHEILDLLQVSADHPILSVENIEGLLPLFESIIQLASNLSDPACSPLLAEQLLHIAIFLRTHTQNNKRPAPWVDERVEQAITFMRANLTRSCTLEEIATAAGISVPRFSKLFRRHTGSSPLRFFTRWRMQRAGDWLEYTHDPVSTIASRIGYQDALYFCRVFRQHMGLSPRQYRQHVWKLDKSSNC